MKVWLNILISIVMVFALFGCATMEIAQEEPQKGQCFQSRLNPFNLMKWERIGSVGTAAILQNPNKDARPKIVVITVHPMLRLLWRYAYMDGKHVKAYIVSTKQKCYVEEEITPQIREWLKKVLLRAAKEQHVAADLRWREVKEWQTFIVMTAQTEKTLIMKMASLTGVGGWTDSLSVGK